MQPTLLHTWKEHKKLITCQQYQFSGSFPGIDMTVQTLWIMPFPFPNKCKLAVVQYLQTYKLKITRNTTNILTYMERAQETD